MIYIVKSDFVQSLLPENSEGRHIQFKKGLFMIDSVEDYNTYGSVWEQNDILQTQEGDFHIILATQNKKMATVRFLMMKVKELKSNSYDFYFPTSFKKIEKNMMDYMKEYPEYTI